MTQALSGPVEQHVTAAAVITVMATVLFALLLRDAVVVQLAQQLGADPFKQYLLVAIMGVAGAIGCLLAAAEPQTFRPQWSLAGGFAVSAAAMLAALLVNSWERLVVFSGVAALAAGWVAVVLSMVLRPAIGSEKLGMWIGVGVGLAFALFSLPQIYLAAAAVPALVAAAAAAAGMVAAVALRPRFAATSFSPDYQSRVWLAWIVMLLVLVWMDKAALFVIRGAAVQHEFQWDGWWSQGSTACLHFLIAALAGAAFDRGWAAGMLLLAMVLLLAACNLSQADTQAYAQAQIFYALGASIYVTALVFYPARGGQVWLAAGLLAIARWIGGALGSAMALALGGVPKALLLGIALVGVLAVWQRARLRERRD